jgi:hypothetical protein
MNKKELEKWLFDHQKEEGSPDFERVLQQYKKLVDAGGDPLKAAENEYNALASGPDSPENRAAMDRLRTKIADLGGQPKMREGPLVSSQTSEQSEETREEPTKGKSDLPSQADFEDYLQGARMAQLLGAGVASAKYLPNVTRGVLGPTIGAISQSIEEGRMRAAPPPVPPSVPPSAPAIPANPAVSALSGASSPIVVSPNSPVAGSALQAPSGGQAMNPAGGRGTANYGQAFGLGEIERNRALDMTKNEGGVHDLTTKKRTALNRLSTIAPEYREIHVGTSGQPTGLMLNTRNARESYVQRPPEPTALPSQQTTLQPTTPTRAYTPAQLPPPPPPSGLEQVRQTFTRMANSPIGQNIAGAARAVKRGVGALGTIGAGSEGFLNLYDMIDALQKDKYGRAAMSGAKAAAMGAMIRTPYGLIPAAMLYGADYLNDATARAKFKALHGMSPQQAYESEGGFYISPE